MEREQDEKLVKAYPNLYSDRHGDITETCMPWGFEVSSGWYKLIDELSSKLEPIIEEYRKNHPLDEDFPKASQVKSKFGGLRFYMSSYVSEIMDIINEYENKSYHTCEYCGREDAGSTNFNGWLVTLCPDCEFDRWLKINNQKDGEDLTKKAYMYHKEYIKWLKEQIEELREEIAKKNGN